MLAYITLADAIKHRLIFYYLSFPLSISSFHERPDVPSKRNQTFLDLCRQEFDGSREKKIYFLFTLRWQIKNERGTREISIRRLGDWTHVKGRLQFIPEQINRHLQVIIFCTIPLTLFRSYSLSSFVWDFCLVADRCSNTWKILSHTKSQETCNGCMFKTHFLR